MHVLVIRFILAKSFGQIHICLIFKYRFFSWFRRQEKTVMKLVVDSETDKVLGASMCGPDAPEIMQVYSTKHHKDLYIHVKSIFWTCTIFEKLRDYIFHRNWWLLGHCSKILILLGVICRVLLLHSNAEPLKHSSIAQ